METSIDKFFHISNEIDLNPEEELHTISLNWNMKEFIYTGFHISNYEEVGQDEMLIKVDNITFPNDISLKHFARLAVLTSFSEEEISKQNIPNSLFHYLGIEK